ncbi:hypothetical protein [Vibrio mediterranei]|uniref:hypothetical protein n=1 Tax=Vibrio mediterranei TaxID=689 RepID=UPI0040690B73
MSQSFGSIKVAKGHTYWKMNSAGPIGFNPRNTAEVCALLANGSKHFAHFGGFIDATNVIGLRRVKLLDIRYICSDEEAKLPVIQIPFDHYTVGTYLNGRFYILVYEQSVKHHLRKDLPLRHEDNVTKINPSF